jgi:molybdopterin converting factor small subunit
LIKEGDEIYLSTYEGESLSDNCIKDQIRILSNLFAEMHVEFYSALTEQLIKDRSEWTDQRLIDAVDNLLKTHKYQKFTYADIFTFEKKERLISKDELSDLFIKNRSAWDNYNFAVEVDGKRYYSKIKQNV